MNRMNLSVMTLSVLIFFKDSAEYFTGNMFATMLSSHETIISECHVQHPVSRPIFISDDRNEVQRQKLWNPLQPCFHLRMQLSIQSRLTLLTGMLAQENLMTYVMNCVIDVFIIYCDGFLFF